MSNFEFSVYEYLRPFSGSLDENLSRFFNEFFFMVMSELVKNSILKKSIFVFGGQNKIEAKTEIYEFSNSEWTEVGNSNTARVGHRSGLGFRSK